MCLRPEFRGLTGGRRLLGTAIETAVRKRLILNHGAHQQAAHLSTSSRALSWSDKTKHLCTTRKIYARDSLLELTQSAVATFAAKPERERARKPVLHRSLRPRWAGFFKTLRVRPFAIPI